MTKCLVFELSFERYAGYLSQLLRQTVGFYYLFFYAEFTLKKRFL
ncbi:hypothetical protein SPHINGO8BC_51375 [Sphingobacterium multivorum]|uniref:Uncharacterized protein n=1 Tax=Sphingobacterium multivorum TaxID=28454 RepID=A0A654D1Z3_SPHMU|nr:hypothetical protein SPHINGO8BC_51375 [Sphingobacterium multivorum]